MEWFNTDYIYLLFWHFYLGAYGFLIIDTLIKLGLFSYKLKEKWITFTNNKYFPYKISFIYYFLLRIYYFDFTSIFNFDFNKLLGTINLDKIMIKNFNPNIPDNNVSSNVSNNNINPNVSNNSVNVTDSNLTVNNPNINVPISVGSAITQAAGSLGLGAAVVAGIRGIGRTTSKMSPAARATVIGAGGIAGGAAFVVTNLANTYLQNSSTKIVNNSTNNKDGPFPAKSIIEEGDNVDNIMNILYFNLIISVCILLLVILLIYFYKKNREYLLYITWVFLVIISYISVYLAYNLLEDISIISKIYQNFINYSVLKNGHSDTDGVKLAIEMLTTNLVISGTILILLYALSSFYISSRIIEGKWNLSFIKNIFGERFYLFYVKIRTYGSKTNKAWMLYNIIILIICSIISIFIGYFLINYIDLITEMYEYSKK